MPGHGRGRWQMAESAEEVYARVVAQVGVDGRLPMPPVEEWDIFPYEGEMRPKGGEAPRAEGAPRRGASATRRPRAPSGTRRRTRSRATTGGWCPPPTSRPGCR